MQPHLPADFALDQLDHTLWLIGCSCDYVEQSFPIPYKISHSLLIVSLMYLCLEPKVSIILLCSYGYRSRATFW